MMLFVLLAGKRMNKGKRKKLNRGNNSRPRAPTKKITEDNITGSIKMNANATVETIKTST